MGNKLHKDIRFFFVQTDRHVIKLNLAHSIKSNPIHFLGWDFIYYLSAINMFGKFPLQPTTREFSLNFRVFPFF